MKGEILMEAGVGGLPSDKNNQDQPLKEVERVRSEFPETWLWRNFTVG